MTQCQVCEAKTALFLCNQHVEELGDMLTSLVTGGSVTEIVVQGRTASGGGWHVERQRRLVGLLEHLSDSAIGHTRLGDGGGRRGPRRDDHLDGERSLASHIEAFPNDDEADIGRARRQRARTALNHALAAGGINSRAATLIDQVRQSLTRWEDHVSVLTGVKFTPADPTDIAAIALWLADHTHAIAKSEQAGAIYRQVRKTVDKIEAAINRPVPPKTCGPCPSIVVDKDNQRERTCGIALLAPEGDTHVKCPECKNVHDVVELRNRLINQTGYRRYSLADTYRIIAATLGDGETLPPKRTFYDWCAKARKDGRLKTRGYQRPLVNPDDPNELPRIGISQHSEDDEPMFSVADVRRVLIEPQPDKRRKVKA